MAEREEDPEIGRWKKRLRAAKHHQESFAKNWDRNEKLIYGRSEKEPTPKEVVVAYGFGLAKSLESAIYVQDPEGIAEAYDPINEKKAKLWSQIVPYDFGVMDVKSKGNIGILDNMIYGYFSCIELVKSEVDVRWKSDEEEGEKRGPGRPKKPKPEDATPLVRSQEYEVNRIHPRDFLPDPQGLKIDLSDHRYLSAAFYPSIGSLKEDALFSKNLPEEIDKFPECYQQIRRNSPEDPLTQSMGKRADEQDMDFKTICVWEVYDLVNNEILYITDHRSELIGRMDLKLKLKIGNRKLPPITIMAFNPSPVGWYPTPECDLISNQLEMLNRLDAMIYKDALTKWRKFWAFGNIVDPDIQAKITDPKPENSIITIDAEQLSDLAGTNVNSYPDGRNFIGPIPDPQPKQDLIAVREMCIQEIMEIIGYGPPARGGMPKTRSAREAMAIKEKMEARLHIRTSAITDFYRLLSNKHIQIVQQTLEVERYVRILPSEAQAFSLWKRYDKDQIDGSFEYIIYAGSSLPKNTESKRASEQQLFNTVTAVLLKAGLPLEPAFLRLADAYQWRGVEQFFKNYKAAIKKLALVAAAMQKGDPNVKPDVVLNAIGEVVMAGLNQGEIAELAQVIQGKAKPGEPQGGGGGGGGPAGNDAQRGDPTPDRTNAGQMPS